MNNTKMLALAATLGPAPATAPFPVIELGQGNVVIGESLHDGRLPALWFGSGGLGMGVEKVMDRYAQDGETLAVVSFDNVQGLDVLTEVLQRIRRTSFPEATSAFDAAAERRKGRAEALQILMGLDPDCGIDDFIGWSSSVAPEDEGSAFWDGDKLRELLDVDTDLADMLDKAEAEFYHQTGLREEAERLSAAAVQAHEELRDQVGQAISDEIARGAEQPDWCDSREIDRLANAAMLVLLMNTSRERAPAASPADAPVTSTSDRIAVLEKALKFYADGEHFHMHDPDAWDTVSGEPMNFYEDESNTATVEDGSVAKLALAGTPVVDDEGAALAAPVEQAGVPDGWKLVPVTPTEDMVVDGFESAPDEGFSPLEVWEKYEAMSGCQQAAYRARLCYAAMLAAAPLPPVVARKDGAQ